MSEKMGIRAWLSPKNRRDSRRQFVLVFLWMTVTYIIAIEIGLRSALGLLFPFVWGVVGIGGAYLTDRFSRRL